MVEGRDTAAKGFWTCGENLTLAQGIIEGGGISEEHSALPEVLSTEGRWQNSVAHSLANAAPTVQPGASPFLLEISSP